MRKTKKRYIAWKNVIGLGDFLFMRKKKMEKPENETLTHDLITPAFNMCEYIIYHPTISYKDVI